MADKTIGFSIVITGTDTGIKKMGDLKRETLTYEKELEKLNEHIKGNVGATLASADKVALLESKIKLLNAQYRQQQKLVVDTAKENLNVAGSYNAIAAENVNLSAQLRALPIDATNEQFIKLRDTMLENENKLKAYDAAIGRNQRNVGNYPNIINVVGHGIGGLTGLFGTLTSVLGMHSEAVTQVVEAGREMATTAKELTRVKHLEHAATTMATGSIQAESVAHMENSTIVVEETVVQKALNFVKTGWIGIAAIALVAVGAAIAGAYAYITASKKELEIEELKSTAIDGSIIKNKELRDSYNESLVAMIEITNAYKVYRGEITQADADVANLAAKNKVMVQEITNDTAVKLREVSASWGSIFKEAIGFQGAAQESIKEQMITIAEEGHDKVAAIDQKAQTEKLKKQAEADIEFMKQQHEADYEARQQIVERRIKEGEERDKAAKERLAANFDLLKKLEQQNAELIANPEEKELEKLRIADKYARLDLALSKASAKFKHDELIMLDKLLAKDRLDIQTKYDEKHQANVDAAAKQLAEAEKSDDAKMLEATKEAIKKLEEADKKRIKDAEEREKAFAETKKQAMEGLFGIAKDSADAQYQSQVDTNTRELDATVNHLSDMHDTEIKALDDKLHSGAITEAQYRIEKEDADKKFREEELKAKKEAFEKDKEFKKAQIEINLMLELIQIALSASENPTNGVTYGAAGVAQYALHAGIALAGAAIAIAGINKQKFKDGAILSGPSHDQGGIDFTVNGKSGFEAEGGEALINKRSTAMFRPLLSRINQAGGGRSFALGGIPIPSSPSIAMQQQNSGDLNLFAAQIINGINDKKVNMLESEVSGAQTKARMLESASTF